MAPMFHDDAERDRTPTDGWKRLDREAPAFRLAQEPLFNLSEVEEEVLERLREGGLEFDLLPRPDPTAFLALSVHLDQVTQRVEMEVDRSVPTSCSFLARKNSFAEGLKGWLDRILGSERFDVRRYVASRRYVWYSYVLPPGRPDSPPSDADSRLRRSLFNFDAKERHFLELLDQAVSQLTPSSSPLKVQVYPRQTSGGGLELMLCQDERRQPARVFVKGFYPVTYQMITENSPLGSLLKGFLDAAVGAEHMDVESSRLKGRFLSLIYSVRHPREILDRFES